MKNLRMESYLKELNAKLELEKKDLEIAFLIQKKKNFNMALYILLALFLLGVLWHKFKGSLYKKEKKKLVSRIKKIKKLNESKEAELMNNSLTLVQNQHFLKELKTDLETSISLDLEPLKNKIGSTTNLMEFIKFVKKR